MPSDDSTWGRTTRHLRKNVDPKWESINLAILAGALVIILYLNASSFDSTEIKTVFQWLLIYGGVRFAKNARK